MPGTTELITFKADMADLRDQLAKLPGLTDKEAKGMVRSLERQLKRAEKASQKAAKTTKSSFQTMAAQAKKTKRSLNQLGGAFSEISPAVGGVVRGFGNLAGGASALANPIGAAVAGMVALSAAAVAIPVAIAGVTVAMAAATLASDELLEELEQFGDFDGIIPPISPEEIAAIERANDAVEAMGLLLKVAVTQIGAEFAPVLEAMATRAVAGGLALLDLGQELRGVAGVSIDAAITLLEFVGALGTVGDALSFIPGAGAFSGSLKAAATGADLLRDGIEGLRDATDPYLGDAEQMIASLRGIESAAGSSRSALEALDEELEASQGLYGIYAENLAGVEGQLLRNELAYSKQIAAIDALVAKGGDQAIAEEARHAATQAMLAEERSIEQAWATEREQLIHDQWVAEVEAAEAAENARLAADEAIADSAKATRDEVIAHQMAIRDASVQAGADIAGSLSTTFGLVADRMAESGSEAAIKMFRIQQAAAVTQIGIDTAAAIMRAYGTMPTPAAAIATAGLVALGAAQAAVVASTPPPEVAHTGAIIGAGVAASSRLNSDERMVKARVGEGVLTTAGVRRIGGAEGLAALNAGRGSSAPIVVAQVYRGRVLDVAIQDQLGRESALRRATSTSRPRGRRNHYNGAL